MSTRQTTILVGTVLTVILMAGCGATYTPPQDYEFINNRIINQSKDQIWKRAVRWFAETNNPVKNIDKESGFIAADRNLSLGDDELNPYCDCGKTGMNFMSVSDFKDMMLSFNILMQEEGENKTRVTVTCSFTAILNTVTSTGYGGSTSDTDPHVSGQTVRFPTEKPGRRRLDYESTESET